MEIRFFGLRRPKERCRFGPVSLRNWPEVHLKRCRCATIICPPGRRSAVAGAEAADASATTHPNESGQARFPPLKLRSPSLAPATWAPCAQVTSALLPRAGETVAAGVVHRLARATLHWPARGARLPDRRPAHALLRGKRSR